MLRVPLARVSAAMRLYPALPVAGAAIITLGIFCAPAEHGRSRAAVWSAGLGAIAAFGLRSLPGAASGARILLADDSPAHIALVRAYLAGTACELEVASDGEDALARLTAGEYDLVLMDVEMPKLDGYEVAARFRRWESEQARARTPLLAVTAHELPEDADRAIRAGADGRLTKPFRRDALMDTIALYRRSEEPPVRVEVPEIIRGIAPEFLRRQRSGLLGLVQSLKSGEFDTIRVFAHNMKGCGKSFGFPRLTELGRDIERAAIERNVEALGRQLEDLQQYLNAVEIAR